MGRPDYEPIIVKGSIATQEDARQRAEDAFEGVIKWLTDGPEAQSETEEVPGQATASSAKAAEATL